MGAGICGRLHLLAKKRPMALRPNWSMCLIWMVTVDCCKKKRSKLSIWQRRNRIKAVVSRINARRLHEATGNWNLYKDSDRQPAMTVDLDEFHTFVREREDADANLADFVSNLQLPTTLIQYEELQKDKDAVLRRVFSLLKCEPSAVGKQNKKTYPR